MANLKRLNCDALKKEDKRFSETKRVELGDYYVDIDLYFRPTKIKTLIGDLHKKLIQTVQEGININEISLLDFIMFYVIKHFSNFSIPDDLSKELIVFQYLIDSNYYIPLCMAFEEKELEKLFDRIAELTNTAENLNASKADLEKPADLAKP